MAYGMKGHAMVNFQDSYGTSQTTSLSAVPIVSESLVLTIDPLVEQGMYSRFQESPYHEGQHLVQGDIQIEALPQSMGWFLKSVFGQVTTTSGTGIQTHVFETKATDFDEKAAVPPMTVELFRDVGSAYQYVDCLVDNFSFNVANGQLLTVTAGFMGSTMTRSAKGTPTYETSPPFLWSQSSVSFDSAAVCDISDLTIAVNNNLEAQYTLCDSKTPTRIVRTGQQTIELSGTFRFNAQSYHQSFESQEEKSFTAHFANDTSPHTLTMEFSKFRWKTFEPTMSGPGVIDATFTAQALYDTASATAGTFTLVNTQTFY